MDKDRLKIYPVVSNEVWIEVNGLMLYVRSTGTPEKPCLDVEHDDNAILTKSEYHKNGYKLKKSEVNKNG